MHDHYPTYKVYAIRYATLQSSRSHTFLGGDANDGPLTMDYYIWAIVGDGRTIVVDTGFKKSVAKKRNRNWLRCPTEGLEKLGIAVGDVSDVIITHLHYDHAGNIDMFPNAKIHIQEREMNFATGRHMCHSHLSFSLIFEQDDVITMVRKLFAQRVVFHDGTSEIAPGVVVHRVGGHTPGMQIVRIWTERGWLVLASDASHLYANMRESRPFHLFVDLAEMFDGWKTVRQLADSSSSIIPGHDPLVMQQYPAPEEALEGIVARLDVAPSFNAFED